MGSKNRRYPYEPDPESPRRPGEPGGSYNEPGAESGAGTPYIEGGGKRPEEGGNKSPDQKGGPFLEPGADPGPE